MKDKKTRLIVSIITGGGTYWIVQFLLKIYEKEMVSKVSGVISLLACIMFFVVVIYLIFIILYIPALCFTSIIIPLIIMSIGLMYKNFKVNVIGILLAFVSMLIWFVILKKYGSQLKDFNDKLRK